MPWTRVCEYSTWRRHGTGQSVTFFVIGVIPFFSCRRIRGKRDGCSKGTCVFVRVCFSWFLGRRIPGLLSAGGEKRRSHICKTRISGQVWARRRHSARHGFNGTYFANLFYLSIPGSACCRLSGKEDCNRIPGASRKAARLPLLRQPPPPADGGERLEQVSDHLRG